MKKSLLLLSSVFIGAALHAQTFTTNVSVTSSDTANPNLSVVGNGGILFKGNSATGTIPATGAGRRMIWFPAKYAFAAGYVNGTQWNTMGTGAAAFGINNTAAGDAGFVAGSTNDVGTGFASTAFGAYNTINNSTATTLLGETNSSGSTANCSFAAGLVNSVSNTTSGAIGQNNVSSGWSSMTFGRGLTSSSAGCVVVGISNTPIIGDSTYWKGADPVFVVGNGTNNTQAAGETGSVQNNALVIYKNGNAKLSGVFQVAPGGDIPMFTGN